MLIKICGVTTVEDAAAAAELGADAVGLNFWSGSPRRVELARAAEIARALGGQVTVVGLFVDAPAEEIARVRAAVTLDVLQLHGGETPEACAAWPADGYWKAVRRLDEIGAYSCTTYLLDAAVTGAVGGTGVKVDRAMAAEAARRARVILAGGLRPEDVAEVIAEVRPFGVDVASGVEKAPGVKDRAKMKAFIEAARASSGPLSPAGGEGGGEGEAR